MHSSEKTTRCRKLGFSSKLSLHSREKEARFSLFVSEHRCPVWTRSGSILKFLREKMLDCCVKHPSDGANFSYQVCWIGLRPLLDHILLFLADCWPFSTLPVRTATTVATSVPKNECAPWWSWGAIFDGKFSSDSCPYVSLRHPEHTLRLLFGGIDAIAHLHCFHAFISVASVFDNEARCKW